MKQVASVKKSELEVGIPKRITYPPFDIALVHDGKDYFAIEDACNHGGASLSEGPVRRGCIVCPMHGYLFDLKTGSLVRPKNLCDAQRVFHVRDEGDSVGIYEPTPLQLIGL